MLPRIREAIAGAVRAAAKERFGADVERVVLERPPKIALGDLACPIAFDLAKTLKKAPRAIATELAPALRLPEGVRQVRVEAAGYLNFFLERAPVVRALLGGAAPAPARPGKVIVEHTNINPNKAAHIGHLRNAVLGDVLVRSLRRLGHAVEVQNYLDDTGVQVADVVAGLVHLQGVRTVAAAAEVIRERRLPGGPVFAKGSHEIVGIVSLSAMDHDERTKGPSVMARVDAYRRVFEHASLIADGMAPNELPPLECTQK